MKAFLVLLLALVFLASVLLDKAYKSVAVKELKRRARSGQDKRAARIYKMAAYGRSLKFLLWLVGGLSAAGLILAAANYTWWAAVLVVLATGWLVLLDRPLNQAGGISWRVAALMAPLVTGFLSFMDPLLSRLAGLSGGALRQSSHTGIYEKNDLLELIDQQDHQADSRVPQKDLKIAYGALTFGDKTVGSVMTPRREVKMVAAGDPIGPHLMDELHASGLSRFPVVKNNLKIAEREIVGTLYLKDLIDHAESGRVRDVMRREVYFINEEQTLRQALAGFLKTQHHLFIVVNNFEEVVGVLSIEDVIEQILGDKVVDEFDRYDDLRTVAGQDAKKEHAQREAKVVE